jgi:hypothetical protein
MLVPPPVPWLVATGKFYRPVMTILCIFMGFTSRSFADIVLYFMDIKADVARELKEFALHSSLPKLVLPASLISKLSPVAAAVLSPRGAVSPKQQKQLSPKAMTSSTSTTVPVPAVMVVAKSMTPLRAPTPPPPRASTPKAPTPKAPTPKAPTPKVPTPKVPRALTPPSRAATPPAKVTTPKELTPVRGDTGLSGSYWLNPAARRATPGGTASGGAGATPGRAVSAARATSIGRAISAGRSGLLDRPTVSSALKRREASPAAARRRR